MQSFENIKYATAYPKGAVLFVEGQAPRGIFVLCKGRVKLSICSTDGKTLTLATGDVLFFCTDGLTDARSPEQAYFEGSLADGLSTLAGKPPADIISGMRRLVLDFCAGVLLDDLTMLVLRVGDPPGT